MNTDVLEQAKFDAERRVLEIQTKLHRWSAADAGRRFDDLYVRREAPRDRAGGERPPPWPCRSRVSKLGTA